MEKKPKKENLLNKINFKDPYHWWGFLILIIGVTMGGAIGGGIGGLAGFSILQLQMKSYKDVSHLKRIGVYSLITIGAIFAYIIVAVVLLSFFPKNGK